mgnify:FL=1|jgi:hypothetical protein
MKLVDIKATDEIFHGEYLYHEPSARMVLCGQINVESQTIKVMAAGRMMTDDIQNFKKIELSAEEHRRQAVSRCKGCGK